MCVFGSVQHKSRCFSDRSHVCLHTLQREPSAERLNVIVSGPENPWLVQAYVRAAVHPFASVVGQEVFQSGVIPSDTDFRIYRDFGNIPGMRNSFTPSDTLRFIRTGMLLFSQITIIVSLFTLYCLSSLCRSAGIDLAFIENGFIYHTKYDTPERIHTDSIQRAGETLTESSNTGINLL